MGKFTNAIRLPSAKFPTVDTSYSGVVLDLVDVDVPAFNTKGQIDGVVTNEDGEVLQQVDVTLETATGKVILHTGGAIYYAIGRALAEVGSDDLVAGDTLTVMYTGDGTPTAKGRNAPKQYDAVIVKA